MAELIPTPQFAELPADEQDSEKRKFEAWVQMIDNIYEETGYDKNVMRILH